jgi:hypothetical protein
MPLELEVEVLANEEAVATVVVGSALDVEVDISNANANTTLVTEVEVAEVQLPNSISFEDTVKNEGNAPGLMVLEAADPVPPGTPAGTVILRKS